jgi:hypothetical protein
MSTLCRAKSKCQRNYWQGNKTERVHASHSSAHHSHDLFSCPIHLSDNLPLGFGRSRPAQPVHYVFSDLCVVKASPLPKVFRVLPGTSAFFRVLPLYGLVGSSTVAKNDQRRTWSKPVKPGLPRRSRLGEGGASPPDAIRPEARCDTAVVIFLPPES